MDQDRTNWGAREYADALNRATAVELVELAQEVNEKWHATGDNRARRAAANSSATPGLSGDDGSPPHSGVWHTASTLLPSGSRTNAP
jgi:hypothetical protein